MSGNGGREGGGGGEKSTNSIPPSTPGESSHGQTVYSTSTVPIGSLRRAPTNDLSLLYDGPSPISNPSLFSKAFMSYSPSVKYTLYSRNSDLRQSWSLESLKGPGGGEEGGGGGEGGGLGDEAGKECFWLDITTPNHEDLSKIASTFGVHPLSIEDIQMKDSREKCEIFEKYLFICIKTCDQKFLAASSISAHYGGGGRRMSERETLQPTTLYLLVFPHFVITVHHEPISHIRRVLRRLYQLRFNNDQGTALDLSSDWIMYSLLDDTVDEFLPQLNVLQMEVDTIDELVLFLTHTEQADMLRRIGQARKRVTHLLRLLKPKTEILRTLTKRCSEYLKGHTLIYLRDVNDHVLTNVLNLDQYAETLNRSHSNYLAQISIELNEASNKMNVVMKKLTAAAAIVLPLSLISGIWGMNVPVPGQDGVSGLSPLLPFFGIVFTMALLMAIMYYAGHKHDWW